MKRNTDRFFSISALLLVFSVFGSVFANTYVVNSYSSFNTSLAAASANDTIVWTEGLFKDVYMAISKSGLHIMARSPGKTVFSGASRLVITGNDNTISGFQYLGGNIGMSDVVVEIKGSRNHLTQLNIKDYYCAKYLVMDESGTHNLISYCNLEHKTYDGDKNILSILVDSKTPGYNTIRYCSFKDFPGTGGDMGVEPIRIGLSTMGEFISRSVVEYCYFTQCNGDGEIISNKSRQNVYRYNTFYDNPKAELVLRHGDQGVVYGNFFLNGSGGVRVKEGQNHAIFNNYFSGLSSRSINLQNYDVDPLDSIIIAYNTIVNSAYVDLGSSGSYAPKNVFFANNIFASPRTKSIANATGTETWMGNISHGSFGITLPEGVKETDPLLTANSEGYYGIPEGSPAIDSAKSGYPAIWTYPDMDIDNEVLFDLMQQARPADISKKDVGCSEYPLDSVIRPYAGEDNTGPAYLWEDAIVFLDVDPGKGSIILNPPGGVYDRGTKVAITAVPPNYYTFLEWGGDHSGNTNPDTLLMSADKNISISFDSPELFKVSIYTDGYGKIEIDPPGWNYPDSTVVTITAVPYYRFIFSHWSGMQIDGNANPLEWLVRAELSGTANFKHEWDTIPEGILQNTAGDNTLKIFPNPASDFVSVSLNIEQEGWIDLSIYDLTGKQVMSVFSGRLNPGNHQFNTDLNPLKSGIFMIGLKRTYAGPIMIMLQKL